MSQRRWRSVACSRLRVVEVVLFRFAAVGERENDVAGREHAEIP